MKRIPRLLLLAGLVVAVLPSAASVQSSPWTIQVLPSGWGDADIADVERVLRNTASHLSRHIPELPPQSIFVEPRGGPVVLYQRGADGRLMVHLNTGDRFWAQYAFQFSHELCHVLSRFDEDPTGQRWFEESLCEAASLFVVRGMGRSWMTDAPYSNWSGYAPELTDYAAHRIEKFRPSARFTLAAWYQEHAAALASDAENRDLNTVVAVTLLPMFEAAPEQWQALQYLNAGKPTEPQSLAEYLNDWHRHSPFQHQRFIREIARQFGMEISPG